MPIEEENLKVKKPFIYSYSGQKLGPDWDATCIAAIAISLGRITRFAGHGARFWPVLLHSMTVADLVCEEAKGIALLHDSVEILVSDVPTPFKPQAIKDIESVVLEKIFQAHFSDQHYHNYQTVPELWSLVKAADTEAFIGEIYVIGTKALRTLYTDRSPRAERIVRKYLRKYKFEDYLNSDGVAVLDFIRKVKDYQ